MGKDAKFDLKLAQDVEHFGEVDKDENGSEKGGKLVPYRIILYLEVHELITTGIEVFGDPNVLGSNSTSGRSFRTSTNYCKTSRNQLLG